MAGVMFFGLIKTTSAKLIGIDFGSHAIKAIAISNIRGTYQVDAVVEMLLPKGLIIDNHLQDISQISLVIKKLRKKLPPHHTDVAIAVTGADVMTKILSINSTLNNFELERQVEIEVENNIPFPLDEVFIDFEILSLNENDTSLNNVLVSTARKESVLSHVQCIDETGLKTTIVDVASHALSRAVKFFLPIECNEQTFGIIDIGATQMMINIINQGDVVFNRNKNHGGDICTRMLAENYDISLQEAENMKIQAQFPLDCDNEVLIPFITQTINYLRAELHMFASAFTQLKVTKIVIIGGTSLLPGFLQSLENELSIEIIVPQYNSNLKFISQVDSKLLSQLGSKYLIALGLALRGGSNV